MEVVKEVGRRWEELGYRLGLIRVESGSGSQWLSAGDLKIQGMDSMINEYVRHHPIPSWKNVATALQEMELDKLADEVTTKYVRGMDVNHVTCLIQKLK